MNTFRDFVAFKNIRVLKGVLAGVFAYFFPIFRSFYFEPLNAAPGPLLYLEFLWAPAITGVAFVVLGVLAYAVVVEYNQFPDEPTGPSTAPAERVQLTIDNRLIRAIAIGLESLVSGSGSSSGGS